MRMIFGALLALILAGNADAQSVRQFGSVTPGHAVAWSANGVIKDGGSASSGALSSIGTTGSGPTICATSDLTTAAAYQRICLGSTTAGGGQISVQNFGTATAQPLTFNINGTVVEVPSISGITIGIPIFGGTSGRVLYDNAGFLGEKAVTGTGDAVLATTPTLITPILGVAAATSINKVAITAPTSSATLTIQDGTTLSYSQAAWTPTLIGSTSGAFTYSTQVGSYERVGRQVTVRFSLVAATAGTASGNVQVGGLPFAAAATSNDFASCYVGQYAAAGLAALNYGITGNISPSASVVSLLSNATSGGTPVTVAQAGATFTVLGTCIYRAA